MKLTQKIRYEILKNYCKAKYHAELKKRAETFTKEAEDAVKKLFSDFDFEGAEKFKKYIEYRSYVCVSAFYNEVRLMSELAEKVYFAKYPFCNHKAVSIDFLYPGDTVYLDTTGKENKALVKKFFDESISFLERFAEEVETINAVLLSCNTDKQLTETLAEIMQYYPKNAGTSAQLISMETLNKAKSLLQAL